MSELMFYGASDDLIEVEGVFREEYTLPRGDYGDFLVSRDDGQGQVEGCRVRVRYTDIGTWGVEVSMMEDGFLLPWPVRFGTPPHSSEYSVALILNVPDDVRVEPQWSEEES
jgi:hypothetical protein